MWLAVSVVCLEFCACLKHCQKENPSVLSCIQVRMQLYSVNVFVQRSTQAGLSRS